MPVVLRAAVEADHEPIVRLNAGEVQHTSPMDIERLRHLHALAWRHVVAEVDGQMAAFLLVMRDGAPYANANFEWFAARYPRFAYVDRIVVGADWKGLKLGSRLYEGLIVAAREAGRRHIACEYNLVPANEASRRFHDRFGFREVGRQWLDDGGKQVSMQVVNVQDGRSGSTTDARPGLALP